MNALSKISKASLLTTGLTLALISNSIFAADYYVNNNGDDSHDGSSHEQAFYSIKYEKVADIYEQEISKGSGGGTWYYLLIVLAAMLLRTRLKPASFGAGLKTGRSC